MNYEKIRTQLWTNVYMSTDEKHEVKVERANKAVDAFDAKFDIDDMDMDVSVDDIIDVLRKAKHN